MLLYLSSTVMHIIMMIYNTIIRVMRGVIKSNLPLGTCGLHSVLYSQNHPLMASYQHYPPQEEVTTDPHTSKKKMGTANATQPPPHRYDGACARC